MHQSKEPDQYFVSGGFAFTHENSVTDIAAVEACKLDELDPEVIGGLYDTASKALSAAADGSVEKANAQIDVDTLKAIAFAVGKSL